MSHFDKFSAEIDKILAEYKTSRLIRFACWLEYLKRKYWDNRPIPFPMVKSSEGEAVGEPMEVYHLSLYDMMEHEARGQLTAEVLLKGRRINSFSYEGHKQMEEHVGRTTIQPRWV